ncbi:CatA-like O-acetyltransferase [Clostridium sp.]|uniref:CatA-like O-acetyltransferase n=1 Tax=Clostridium sp. TaxID=1506 RepID=UPI00262715EB|nr:CatA-like O-acetyltransferase [uncultured Clostridium sp.]
MNIKKIDMNSYPRKSHFEYFRNMAYPYVGATVNIDITYLVNVIKREKLPFFLTVIYIATNAANKIPEFKRRIDGDSIIEYSHCNTSHTVALEDGTYCYCELDSSMNYKKYLEYAQEKQRLSKIQGITDDGSEADSLFFVSCLPWISYTAIIQPVPSPSDCNPRITFGRYFRYNDKILMPTTILVNHALVDGIHIAKFYGNFDEIMAQLIDGLQK